MEITRGYKTELDLNDEQITACKKHAGVARFAYNWGLHRRQEVYQTTGRSIWAMDLHRELNALKQTEFPWMYRYRAIWPPPKCTPLVGYLSSKLLWEQWLRKRLKTIPNLLKNSK